MYLDHTGFVTSDLELFESFWVKILGFKRIFESYIDPEMNRVLFGLEGARAIRYKKDAVVIEVHVYDDPIKVSKFPPFNVFGLNHISLHVKSRKAFLKKYDFDKRVYHNPKGWDNIFIRDFEGNWIELRETF